jgi:hypothetical protein
MHLMSHIKLLAFGHVPTAVHHIIAKAAIARSISEILHWDVYTFRDLTRRW